MAGLSTGGGAPIVKVYHEQSMILPDVARVLACLYEKDVNFGTVKASYKDILRLQAARSVPVPFYDGNTSLQESRAICRYIAETYEHQGYPFLLGKDVLERASIEQWLRHEEHAFDPPSRALFCHLAFPLHDEDMDDIDREKKKLEEVLEVYEQRLGECEFLAGNKFTLADLVHLPNTHHIVNSEKFAYLYDSRKNVRRWWNTISARDSWQQVVMDMEDVEEQNQMEELEQQEQEQEQLLQHQQWYTESPLSGVRTVRIDPRKQPGTESQTVLVPPPSGGVISSSFFVDPQEEQPPPKTSRGEPSSPVKRTESNFFTTTEKTSSASKQKQRPSSTTQKSPSNVHSTGSSFFTSATPPPTTTKTPQRTNTDKSTSKETSSPNRTSQRSSKESPNKLHLSDFYKGSSTVDEAATLAKHTPQKASKTSDVAAKDVQDGTARQVRYRDVEDITKEAREDDTSAPTKGPPSGSQYTPQQSKAPPTDLKVSDMSPKQEEYEGTQGAMDGDERFSTKRLGKMVKQSDPAPLQSQPTDLQAPPEQETPPVYNKPAHVQDRKGQADNISADRRSDSTPSTGARAPDSTPSSGDKRGATSPAKGRIAPDDHHGATEPRKSPSINEQEPTPPVPSQSPTRASHASASSNAAAQDDDLAQLSAIDQWRHTSPQVKQGVPGAPGIDNLDKTTGADRRLQPNTPKKTSVEQSDKTAMDERAPEMKTRQEPPSDTRRTSASTPPSQKPVSSSQKIAERIKGMTATSDGITGDEPASTAMADKSASAIPPQAPASDGRNVSTALQGSTPEARQKNEAVRPSVIDPRGMPTTPKKAAATPDTQRHTTSDQTSEKAPSPPPFVATRNEKNRTAEAGQSTMIAPDKQLDGRADLKNTGAPTAGPLPVKSQKNMDEAYSDRGSTQQLSSDQSRAQPAENKKQGGGAKPVTESGESKEDDFVENSKKNDTAQAQVTSTDVPSSKQQKYSDKNKPKDINNEAVDYRSSTTASRDMLPTVPEKSMGKQQPMQDDRSSVSLQDNNEKQGSEGVPLVYNAEQSKNRGQALPKSEEQTSPDDTQQVENNRSGRKSNGPSKPTQLDGNEGDFPESQKGGTSTRP